MKVTIDSSVLRETKWYSYVVRFIFGGLVTVLAGAIAKSYGPVVGGLFLAFPAIFPASATLAESHERQKKEEHGVKGEERGKEAAGADAAGAAMGGIGLVAFGAIVWWLASEIPPWLTLLCATVVWFGVSVLLWWIRKKA